MVPLSGVCRLNSAYAAAPPFLDALLRVGPLEQGSVCVCVCISVVPGQGGAGPPSRGGVLVSVCVCVFPWSLDRGALARPAMAMVECRVLCVPTVPGQGGAGPPSHGGVSCGVCFSGSCRGGCFVIGVGRKCTSVFRQA